MRVCYHVQSHRDQHQTLRLMRTLREGSSDAVLHLSHDKHGPPLENGAFAELGVTVSLDEGGYGDFSHVERHLKAIRWLVESETRVDWMVNLTGQDYPVMPLTQIEAEMADCPSDGFLEHREAFTSESTWPDHRYWSRYFYHHRRLTSLTPKSKKRLRAIQAVNKLQPFYRVHVSHGLTVGRRASDPFGPAFRLYGGSAFMSINWKAVKYLYGYERTHPEILEYFRKTISPVEAAFPTILGNAPNLDFEKDCKRYFDFSGSTFGHPRTLTVGDIPLAVASGAHFARKFSADDEETYRALDVLVQR